MVVEIDGTMSKDVRFGRLPLRHNLKNVEPSCNLERTILGRQFALSSERVRERERAEGIQRTPGTRVARKDEGRKRKRGRKK